MSVLDEASGIVDGPRREMYGHPKDNHGATAEFWTTYLRRRDLLAEGGVLDAHDVCMLNSLQKHSREANVRTRDNLVDIAGFVYNAEIVTADADPEYDRVRKEFLDLWIDPNSLVEAVIDAVDQERRSLHQPTVIRLPTTEVKSPNEFPRGVKLWGLDVHLFVPCSREQADYLELLSDGRRRCIYPLRIAKTA